MEVKGAILTDFHLEVLRSGFQLLDRDKTGSLTRAQLLRLLAALDVQLPEGKLEDIVSRNTNTELHEGTITFPDFVRVFTEVPQKRSYTDTALMRAFQIFADNNAPPDHISIDNIRKALMSFASVTEEEAGKLTDLLNAKDGVINYREKVTNFFRADDVSGYK